MRTPPALIARARARRPTRARAASARCSATGSSNCSSARRPIGPRGARVLRGVRRHRAGGLRADGDVRGRDAQHAGRDAARHRRAAAAGRRGTRSPRDGEILLRGPNVFPGYYADELATREALDEHGWLRTGDLGTLDDGGYLRITGRTKDLIITSSGKNVTPSQPRGGAARDPLGLAGGRVRRPPALPRRAAHARPRRAAGARRTRRGMATPTPPRIAADPRVRELLEAEVDGGQRALRADRADQALRDPRPRPLAGRRRADADAEAQAQRRLRALRATDVRACRSSAQLACGRRHSRGPRFQSAAASRRPSPRSGCSVARTCCQ